MNCLVRIGLCTALCVGALAPTPAFAQTDDAARSAAREVGTRGVEAYQRDDFATASEKLEKAYQVLKVPSIGLWSARALAKLGKLVKASERYQEVTRLEVSQGQVGVQKQAQADAASELAQLAPRIPSVVIKLEGAGSGESKLTIDGAPMSAALVGERWPVDPGPHVVEASAGASNAREQVSLAEGESKTIVLRLQASAASAPVPMSAPPAAAAPNPPGSPVNAHDQVPSAGSSKLGTQKVLAITASAIGVIGIGAGSVFGLQAKSKNDQAKSQGCSGSTCPTGDGITMSQDAVKAGNLSTVAFIVGGVGLAAGVTLWLTAGPAQTQVGLGPGTIELRRTF